MSETVRRLDISRMLESGESVVVGVLAQNTQGVFFQYDAGYYPRFGNLSPLKLHADNRLQKAPREPHDGLHGVFSDALPDGWGRLLMDRYIRRIGRDPFAMTAMDRLALLGDSGIGALRFHPSVPIERAEQAPDLSALGVGAQMLFEGRSDALLSVLMQVGSSGGARPKSLVYSDDPTLQRIRLSPAPGDQAWIVKFTTGRTALGHHEGIAEALYLTLAEKAGCQPCAWALVDAPPESGATQWLAVKRFDVTEAGGRLHMLSACGLLDADYRAPSLDYVDLIKASRFLCQSPAVAKLQCRRALFNLLALNHDDHTKNWAFLQRDHGGWEPAPWFDVTYSPHPFGEHAMSYRGFGSHPSKEALMALAEAASMTRVELETVMHAIVEVLMTLPQEASALGLPAEVSDLIATRVKEQCEACLAAL